jgi:hypothetical protein
MRRILRLSAVAVAFAGFVDPAIARRMPAPLSVALHMPPVSDPGFETAEALRGEILSTLDDRFVVGGPGVPRAIVAIGNAPLPQMASPPVFALDPTPGAPSVSIVDLSVPERTVPGQAAYVTAVVRGRGLAGREASAKLELRGAAIETVRHAWTQNDESFLARFSFVPPTAGVHRTRVVVRTEGLDQETIADAVVAARAQSLRVLVFEPRPSWPVAFVRRSLEADGAFTVAFTSRSSRAAATSSGDAPHSLDAFEMDRFDAVIVGALDEVRERDLAVLDRFAAERGGTLILLPDRRLPESIRRRFQLPRADEVLLEAPVRVQSGTAWMRASELLLMRPGDTAVTTLGSVRHQGSDRPAIASVNHGSGQVVFSGALDAWRYRADQSGSFDLLWRGFVADGALAAPPRVAVSLQPAIARPGDAVHLSVTLRRPEPGADSRTVTFPPVAAALTAGNGTREIVRLWPGTRPGTYEARLIAPPQGRYSVSASVGSSSTEVPFLVSDDVVTPTRDMTAALNHAARATGGAVLSTSAELGTAMASLDAGFVERDARPMRSVWWMVPFAGLLCAEWALRRRSGLK